MVHKTPNIYHLVLDIMFMQSLANCPFSKEHSHNDVRLPFVHQTLSLAFRWKGDISARICFVGGKNQPAGSEYLSCKWENLVFISFSFPGTPCRGNRELNFGEIARVKGEEISYNTLLRHPAGLKVTTARVSLFGNMRVFPLLTVGRNDSSAGRWMTTFFISNHPEPEMAVSSLRCLAAASGWKSAGDGTVT